MKSKQIVRTWTPMLFALWVMMNFEIVTGQTPDVAKLDELLTYFESRNEAMGSLAISKNGVIIYNRAIGYRRISDERKIPADTETKYRLWSVSKIYTATMILQLVEEGAISLDSRLDQFFPDIPNAEIISIKDMMSHKSGIHDFTRPDSLISTGPASQKQADMVKYIASFRPDFNPGERFDYSNSNYLLLGYIIENLDNNPFGESLSKRISARAGLRDTYFGTGSLDTVENKSFSYQMAQDGWHEVSEGEFSSDVPGGAGSIVSTSADMVRFIESLFTGKLITMERLHQMTDIQEFYGFGIFKKPYKSHLGFGHTGGYLASRSTLAYYPQDSLAVAYCTNGEVYMMENIISQILAIHFNKEYVLPHKRPKMKIEKRHLLRYVGSYKSPQFILNIKYEDGHLTAQPEGRPKAILFPSTMNRFFMREDEIEIEFCLGDAGDRLFILHGENKVEAKRIGK